ncbi:unnamed protein product [Soboliphyme baturini]|uniref:Angiomotin_C domain-containing protein n=1 Tax=Soboliphyme baturini TaxID=241478 RepID=A0A183INL0_9BILA|nr:unnamed protein product [Soboliphyme baturini]
MTSPGQIQNIVSNFSELPPDNYFSKQQRPIVRVSSTHGIRDLKTSATANVNPAVPSSHVLSPPQYQAAIASMVDSNRFANRRSPEVRAVQAVPPFGVHEAVIPSAIPDECQVNLCPAKCWVVSGQLIPATTSSSAASSTGALAKVPPSGSILPAVFPDTPSKISSELPPLYHHCFAKNNPQYQSPGYGNATSSEFVKPEDVPRSSISQPDISRLNHWPLSALNVGDAAPRRLADGSSKVPYLTTEYKNQIIGEASSSSGCQAYSSNNARHLSAPPPAYFENKDAAKPGTSFMADKAAPGGYAWLYNERNAESDENRVTAQMMNLVTEENRFLRLELESYIKKTFKLQQVLYECLELQYQKIQREYEELVRRQEKREQLEQQMHMKMQQEIARLKEFNYQLNEQLENALTQMSQYQMDEVEDHELKHEITRRDMMIAQLITQNKELLAAKERYTIELDAQRATLEEQRAHIQILDKALINAQEKVLKAEEQSRKKNIYVQKAEELQRALHTFQDGMKKREDNHKRIRAQLEKELAHLQIQKKENQNKALSSTSLQDLKSTTVNLRRDLQDKEEQMLNLQSEVVRWQEAYYDELKKQEAALSEAASSKDARIRILEENSSKAEKLIEVAQSESKRYLEDLRNAKNKVGDLETRVQSLEAQMAEKDAMINVLRRRQRLSSGSDTGNRSADATLDYSSSSDVMSTYNDAYQ